MICRPTAAPPTNHAACPQRRTRRPEKAPGGFYAKLSPLLAPSRPSDGPSDRSTTTPTDTRPPHDLGHRHGPNPIRITRSRGPRRRSRFPGLSPGLGLSGPQRDNHAAAETLPGRLSQSGRPRRKPNSPPSATPQRRQPRGLAATPSLLSNPTTGPRPVTTGPFPAGRRSPPDGGQLPIPACRFSLQFCLVSGRSFLRRDQPFSFPFRRLGLELLISLCDVSILTASMHAFRFSQNPYWRTHPLSTFQVRSLNHCRTPPPPRKSYPCLSTRSYLKL